MSEWRRRLLMCQSDGPEQYDYCKTAGNYSDTTGWIDTGLAVPSIGTIVRVDIVVDLPSVGGVIFGTTGGDGHLVRRDVITSDSVWIRFYDASWGYGYAFSGVAGTYHLVTSFGTGDVSEGASVNDTSCEGHGNTSYNLPSGNYALGASYTSTWRRMAADKNIAFRSVKIWYDDVLMRDMYPSIVEGKPGMYDKVTKMLYGNSWRYGSLIVGNDE